MTALDLSADVGLLAVFLSTANICLGLLIAVRYSPWRLWPHRRINIFAVHNWTAYFLMASVLTHPFIFSGSDRTPPVEAVPLPRLCSRYLHLHSRHARGSRLEGEPH